MKSTIATLFPEDRRSTRRIASYSSHRDFHIGSNALTVGPWQRVRTSVIPPHPTTMARPTHTSALTDIRHSDTNNARHHKHHTPRSPSPEQLTRSRRTGRLAKRLTMRTTRYAIHHTPYTILVHRTPYSYTIHQQVKNRWPRGRLTEGRSKAQEQKPNTGLEKSRNFPHPGHKYCILSPALSQVCVALFVALIAPSGCW